MPQIRKKFNYRRNLVVTLILLQLLTVASILLLSKINTEKVLINNAYQSMAKTIAQSGEHARSFLKPAHMLINKFGILVENNIIDFNDIVNIEKHFFSALIESPDLAGIYIANTTGDFVYMLRLQTQEGSADTFQTKYILHKNGNREVFYKWRDENFNKTRQEEVTSYNYDPRTRPWYQLAKETKGIAWTDPYTFFTSKELGITASKAGKNQNDIIIGLDIEISKLSGFLSSITDNADDYIRITDEAGNFIADSGFNSFVAPATITNIIKNKSKESGTFEEHKQEFLFTQKPLKSDSNEPNWSVFTYAKTAPFLTEIRSTEKRNILIALATFLLSIIISSYIASRTSKPVENWMTQASTDNLTGLYNRHYFFNTANTIYNQRTEADAKPLALLMIDVDFFKRINDNYGHNIGDDVLKGLGECLQSLFEEDVLLARHGGEEFILLTEIDSHKEAIHLAETIRETIENKSMKTSSGNIKITVSIGLSFTDGNDKLSFLEFIDTSDKALYQSKNNGRNQVTVAG